MGELQRTPPAWLRRSDQGPFPKPSPAWISHRRAYFDDLLADINKAIGEGLRVSFATDQGLKGEYLHVNTKIALFIALVILAAGTRQLELLLLIHVGIAAAAWFLRLSLKQYLTRTWLPAIAFAGIGVLPSIFSIITPGDALLTLVFGKWTLVVTRQGLISALFVLLRATTSLGLVMLLSATTRWSSLTTALRKLGLPSILIAVLDVTYRYLFLFLLLLAEYVMGRKSRVVSKLSFANNLSWIGCSLAGFFRLTDQYGQEITQALMARGYTGAFPALPYDRPYRAADKAAAALLLIGTLLYIGRMLS